MDENQKNDVIDFMTNILEYEKEFIFIITSDEDLFVSRNGDLFILDLILNKISSYYNKFGDKLMIQGIPSEEYSKVIKKYHLYIPFYYITFNILLLGKARLGKSSLINKLLGTVRCKYGWGIILQIKYWNIHMKNI